MADITLPERLNISGATDLHAQLCSYLGEGARLSVDASAVRSADTAGLQLLLSLKRSAAQLEAELSFADCSEALMRSAAALGLEEQLLTHEPPGEHANED